MTDRRAMDLLRSLRAATGRAPLEGLGGDELLSRAAAMIDRRAAVLARFGPEISPRELDAAAVEELRHLSEDETSWRRALEALQAEILAKVHGARQVRAYTRGGR